MVCQIRVIAGVLALGSLLAGAPARADDLTWNGFFTTGTAFSNRSTPYTNVSATTGNITREPQVVQNTYLGLNLAKRLSPSANVAAQFVARDADADGALKANWAFVSFRPLEPLTLTIGKQMMAMWMISEYKDVGTTYPWVRPPEEVYSLLNLKFYTGASVRFDQAIVDSRLSLALYAGETDLETAPSAPTATTKLKASHLTGTALQWTLGKTTARAAYSRGLWDLNIGGAQLGERHFAIATYGLASRAGGFSVLGEYASARDLDEQKYLDEADELTSQAKDAAAAGDAAGAKALGTQALLYQYRIGGKRGFYLTAGYQLAAVALYLTHAEYKYSPLPGYDSDQKSNAATATYDLSADSVLKLEAKRISLKDGSTGLFKVPSGASPTNLDNAMIYSASYNLTF
jgi:hypothetical protein